MKISIANNNLSTAESPNWHVEILIDDQDATHRIDYKLGGQLVNWKQRAALLGYGEDVQEQIRQALNRHAR